jgi:hypothetical protein
MSAKHLKSTADLRRFLLESIVEVKSGEMPIDRANTIGKLSAQVNESLRIEIQAVTLLRNLGQAHETLGDVPLSTRSVPTLNTV